MKALARTRAALSAVLAFCGAVGCSGPLHVPMGEASRESARAAARPPPPSRTAPVDSIAGEATRAQEGARPKSATLRDADLSSLGDAQLAAVVEALYDGEIRLAQVALYRAADPGVRRLAYEMVVAYEGLMRDDTALWVRLQFTPSANPVSEQLHAETQREAVELAGTRGPEFDREYVDTQIRDQTRALALLDRISAKVDAMVFKTELTVVRSKLDGTLCLAESVQKDPPAAGTDGTPR